MFDDHSHGRSPEQDLWQSVLLAIVEDALFGSLRRVTPRQGAEERNAIARTTDCQTARDYLTRPSRDLATVCALGGLDMWAVIEHMTRQIAAAPSPEELARSTNRRATKPKQPKPVKPAKTGPKQIPFEGECLTIAEWAERTGLPQTTIKTRLAAGWPIDRILTEPRGLKVKRPRKDQLRPAKAGTPARTLTHAGETLTIRQWSERIGLSKGAIERRLRFGWHIDQVLSSQNMRGKSFAGQNLSGNQP
ncbi:MAG: hypothetical protein K9G71_01360 [Rhodobacteraceae bacterium]|nr:hypothetical protein [Paracoccaceae bacterium]MCF8512975.1 hypothetical protein [Paracoccaceae bacterium]MCF8517220.1 hypothetical protein [Paracoccaceae bacterium]